MGRIVRPFRAALMVLAAILLLATVGLLVSLSIPVESWRTGEPPARPLELAPGQLFADMPMRVWIDTDAGCGHSSRTDPDDCLAILLLSEMEDIEIVGISVVFGNSPLAVTERTTRALMEQLKASGLGSAPVYRGSEQAMRGDAESDTNPAQESLRAALEAAPLTILALGPATNIATALQDHPDLQVNVVRIVSVMGRRRGHLFHPVEGGTARSLFGHGPVFRDFNFAQDELAAAAMLKMELPLTFVPYEAARDVMINGAVLDGMAARGGAAAWTARRSRDWLTYWWEDIAREGFYPFDLVAAVYLAEPTLLWCTELNVYIGKDAGLLGWLGVRGLFVKTTEPPASETAASRAKYCPETARNIGDWLSRRLTGSHPGGIAREPSGRR